MNFIAVIKRVVPFFLTFAVGLFIASLFITVAAPNFQFKRGWKKNREYNSLKFENKQLREENSRLEKRIAELERKTWEVKPDFDLDFDVPPVPPSPPTKLKVVPMESVPVAPSKVK